MPMPKIQITKRKDGREQAWFRDASGGRVRTSSAMSSRTIGTEGYSAWRGRWARAEQIQQVANYGIALQVQQARSGIGSSGTAMPPLRGGHHSVFVARVGGRAVFARKTYADRKAAMGLQPVRDLWGPGKGGHMLDEIRINSLDDRRATVAITSKLGRDKARANERRAPWWGWTRESVRKMFQFSASVYQTGVAEDLFALGLIGADALSRAKRLWRKVA